MAAGGVVRPSTSMAARGMVLNSLCFTYVSQIWDGDHPENECDFEEGRSYVL